MRGYISRPEVRPENERMGIKKKNRPDLIV
jgi:hypothetical protein